MSSIAFLMGKKHVRHCEQHGSFFQTNICNSKHGIKSFSAANKHNSSAGYYANSQEKEGFQNTK